MLLDPWADSIRGFVIVWGFNDAIIISELKN